MAVTTGRRKVLTEADIAKPGRVEGPERPAEDA